MMTSRSSCNSEREVPSSDRETTESAWLVGGCCWVCEAEPESAGLPVRHSLGAAAERVAAGYCVASCRGGMEAGRHCCVWEPEPGWCDGEERAGEGGDPSVGGDAAPAASERVVLPAEAAGWEVSAGRVTCLGGRGVKLSS